MKLFRLTLISLASLLTGNAFADASNPNILWIVTDDQRYDSIRSFNKILTGEEMSPLGYVESPQVDRLATMGTTFINTYCQAMGCAPSRASMHYGRYPFRSGVYEFEYHNNAAPHSQPSFTEHLVDMGYHTVQIGKLGFRLRELLENGRVKEYRPYEQSIYFRDLWMAGLTDWGKSWIYEADGVKFDQPVKEVEFFVTPEGEFEYASFEIEKLLPKRQGDTAMTVQKYDLHRHYNSKKPASLEKGMVISGVSPQLAGKTRDGYYNIALEELLKNENQQFELGALKFAGVNTEKPLFVHLGYDFPHTPVLPPADYRARFQKYDYKIPKLTKEEFAKIPAQIKRALGYGGSDHYSDEQKLKIIQDYFAFCAYGDTLVGEAVDTFISYSEKHNQPWMVVYVCGDHGFKLNEHGALSKFTPWDIDQHNPIIVVSSEKEKFPAGKVVTDFTEFMDIAPTILSAAGADLAQPKFDYLDGFDLAKIASSELPARDYVVGESHAVTGPRAYIRTKEYVFSMQTRPDKKHGGDMQWALKADYKDLDPALYHMPSDPAEVDNVAFNPEYRAVADKMKEKLINIVLGDGRVEVEWGKKADGTETFRSNFAPGSHDGRLKL
ncbi:MAG: sulfatase-like hydrolase/transferase [Opitutaceae bacterium]